MRRPVSEQWKIPGPNITKKNQFSKYLKNFTLIRKNRQPNRKKKKNGQKAEPAHHRKVRPRGAETRGKASPHWRVSECPLKF